MTLLIATVFILGYVLIATEHFIKINKAATALITGVLCWTLYVLGGAGGHEAHVKVLEHTAEIAGILFFLMGAMTIVEIIDAHNGFDTVTSLMAGAGKRRLLLLVGVTGFFLSAVLDNLTTTIVMVSLLTKILPKREDVLLFAGLVVITVNAGGAWSPIGDVTTTMLWIGGQITTGSIILNLLLPSLACASVPLAWTFFRLKKSDDAVSGYQEKASSRGERIIGRLVFFIGVGVLLFVPVFKTITHLPPFVGMMFGLGVLWIVTEIIHRQKDDESRHAHSVTRALARIDMPSILFFLGILLSITALQEAGILPSLAAWLDRTIGNINVIVLIIGMLSAIIDNVPLVAAAMKMYPLSQFATDHHFWSFLSYCAGTGGSALIIGSAAGVVAMGMVKIEFFWYLKKITPLAAAGYLAGAGVYLLQTRIF
jgi:Na+/H+ antiporter NhaD/arsenite permease-like protein